MTLRSSRIGSIALGLLALVLAVVAALVSAWAMEKAAMPFNEEGNHFDGLVVHHAGSEWVMAALALLLWVLVGLAGWGACRLHRRTRG
jgi:ABC-type spermidine/putrescine transport system permease subunit II